MRRWVALGSAVGVVAVAAIFAFGGRWPWRRLPPAPPPVALRTWIAHDTLRPGETLSDLFGRHGLGPLELSQVVARLGLDPRRLRAGLEFRFGHHEADSLPTDVTLRTDPAEDLRVVRELGDWRAERHPIRWSARTVRIEGTIRSSLSEAMATASSSEPLNADERIRIAWDLADVFAWEIDFTRDIQPDDRFAVVLERHSSDRGESRLGRILASELAVARRRFTAYRFEGAEARGVYFDEKGASLRRAFLRAPVEFRRISSRFSTSRYHPILQIWRRHEGIDYAASAGTPVMAAGDGVALTAGWSGGYGRLVEIRHRNGITTRYGHLRAFARGLHPGRRVRQGEVIGFVGASGLATAPHLHYEFRRNGGARDPARIDLGTGDPVPPAVYPSFVAERRRLEILLRPGPTSSDSLVSE